MSPRKRAKFPGRNNGDCKEQKKGTRVLKD